METKMSKKKSQTKNKKDVKQRQNVRSVFKNDFEYIERVWAEDGVVKTQVKDGRVINMTVRDAAVRAGQLNAMPLPDWHKARRNELIRQIVKACREAKSQMESPRDSKARAMNNLLEGLAPDGRTPEQLMKDHPLEVQEAMKLSPLFPHLSLDEIVSVLKEGHFSKDMKMRLLAEEENGRSHDAMQEQAQIASP
jgi:hypothetical protein